MEIEETSRNRILTEMNQVTAAIESLTGLRSNWNGHVEVAPASASFRGVKPFKCQIIVREDILSHPARWRTLIHEAFHAVSAGFRQTDFLQNIGWEEGLVEQLQRHFRPDILARIGVQVDRDVFISIESRHPFNRYITALEAVRLALREETSAFYLDLIATPIKERYALLVGRALQMETVKKRQVLTVLSASQKILTEGLHVR